MSDENADALTTGLLACGVVGGFGFLAVALVEGALRPRYSALHQPVSMLSLGPGGWVQVANFVVAGLLMVACAVGLRRALRQGRGATWGPILIGLYGLCLTGAGVFSTDPSHGYPPGAALGPAASPSLHGRLHDLTSLIVFAALTAACFVFARRFASRPGDRIWTAYSVLSGIAVPGFFVAAAIVWSQNIAANFGGVFQRSSIAAGWVWIAALAIRTILQMRSRRRAA